jgi:hypothetical protein
MKTLHLRVTLEVTKITSIREVQVWIIIR